MKITLRDMTSIEITNDRGEKLKQALSGNSAPEYIEINNTLVRKDFIVKLEPSAYIEPTDFNQIKAGEKVDNRGTVSQQRIEELKAKAFGGR